ncbi:MAG: GDSL-type esterase/lipase family protein [Ruminococcus sp.]|nr:GDSL-type esterase/lipase family protein [Ruminococcus sp.]MCM1381218.1 GDSL-type esterase/lipase family protein [Muribaculaceae bacterium]MCM1478431.1 GDSL-type esterase/lipase family protein [Muribaculaceae bacterium]
MASYNEKTSPADVAAIWAIVLLTAVLAALVGVYFWRNHSFADVPSADAETSGIKIIGTETSYIPPETTAAETTTAAVTTTVSETTETSAESEKAETAAVSREYTPEFFCRGLIVGDSISVGLVNYGYLQPENVFAQIGLTPSSVLTAEVGGTSVYAKAAGLAPDYICIMLGTNGLSYLSEDFMAEKMGEFIDGLRQICPNAKILLVSIPPVTAAHESEKPEKIENITKYNEHISKLAEEKSAIFVNIYQLLEDSDGYLAADYAESDGLHLKGAAYPVVLSALQTAVESDGYVPTAAPVTTPAATETTPTAATTPVTTVSQPPPTVTETTALTEVTLQETVSEQETVVMEENIEIIQ